MYAYVHGNPMTRFDLYGLFIEDEDITGGRSAHALAAMAYGFGEAVVVGTHDFVCMLHAAERQAEIFENGTLEESNQAFINSYTATAAPIHQAAEALRASVMEKLQSGVRDVNLDHYHTAGSYAAYGVAFIQGGRAVWGVGKSVRTLAVGSAGETTIPFLKPSINPGAESNIIPGPRPQYAPRDPITGKPLGLPKTKHGEPMPSSDSPHTQIGWKKGKKGDYIKTREWGWNGKPSKTTDWTDHGYPLEHTNPHDHPFLKNSTGGTYERGDPQPFKITDNELTWEN